MNTLTMLKKIRPQKIGKLPIVILPLDYFEKMKEDLEMSYSKRLPKEIKEARAEIKAGELLSFDEVKKKLKFS